MLHVFSGLDRVKKCRRVRRSKTAAIGIVHRCDEGRAHFSNLQTCGSVWCCPFCSEKILRVRAIEIEHAIRNWWSLGGSVSMLTLTMRHDRGQSLAELWGALTRAWRVAAGGSSGTRALWRNVRWVKRVEVTHGPNGWHVHIHALLFHARDFEVDALAAVTFPAWSAALQSAGLRAPDEAHAVDVKRLSLAGMRREVAEYLAKGTYTEAVALDEKAAALEIASATKRARGVNRTPFEVLADFVRDGLSRDAEIWREWEQGSFRKRAMTWSAGTRDLLVRDDELDDDQAAAESDGAGELVCQIDPKVWPDLLDRPDLLGRMLQTVELLGAVPEKHRAIDGILVGAGFRDAVRPPPAVVESEP